MPSEQIAMQVAERISMTLCGHFGLSCGAANPSASIGVVCGERGKVGPEELVRLADAAMHRSKSDGRSEPVYAGA